MFCGYYNCVCSSTFPHFSAASSCPRFLSSHLSLSADPSVALCPFPQVVLLTFRTIFRVFYTEEDRPTGHWVPFASRSNGPSWFWKRFEHIRNRVESMELTEHAAVWYSFLAPRDLYLGLKSRSKLAPSTEVFLPYFVARQFGLIQALRPLGDQNVRAKIWLARNRPLGDPPEVSKCAVCQQSSDRGGIHSARFSFRNSHDRDGR